MSERNIRVQTVDQPAVEDQSIEIVERKGMGHPDSICDGVAESVSAALAQAYIDRVGKVLHYNTDETQLVAGSSAPAFGGGEVLQPIYLLIVGRATKHYEGTRIPAERIALEASREYLDGVLPALDVSSDVIIDVKLGEGSGDLQNVFGEQGREVPMANDTSFGVGHAPLSETERIVLETERRLNAEFAAKHAAMGPDVKVMGKREDDQISLTVAAALVDEHVPDMTAYTDTVGAIEAYVLEVAGECTDRALRVDVNTADDFENGSVYLTVTGTSAENGDDGSVGRGNRANGLITPNRSMSIEAVSGKNPVNHIGKIYNLLADEMAREVVAEVPGIRDLRIRLLSQIGKPIDQPQIAEANLVTAEEMTVADIETEIQSIMDHHLEHVTDVTQRAINEKLTTF